jgi:DNA polymerase III subunit gamma/tau
VEALLKDVRPLDVEGNTIVLLAASTFHKSTIEQPKNREIVEGVIKKHLGAVYAVRCTTEAKAEGRDLRGQIREARKDQLVRAAMNIFDAHIVDIEPEEPAL